MRYRNTLPQLDGRLLITDGGLETDLVFNQGFDLPAFASFPLVATPRGRRTLREYFDSYAAIARNTGAGLLLESPTWRAHQAWAPTLGYDLEELDEFNRKAVDMLHGLRARYERDIDPVVLSGCIGPRGDGYEIDQIMSADEAERYHARQIGVLAESGVDMISALTLPYAAEAAGIARAARAANVPAVISFTLETDGRLPSGQSLPDAIAEVDGASDGGPAYYMINCAHPTHFEDALHAGADWTGRIAGVRANASKRSHEELDEALSLDEGDPVEFGHDHARLKQTMPHLTVLGGCCGTDHRHVEQVSAAWTAAA